MEEKNIEFYRFTKPLIDDEDELEQRLSNLTERQKVAYAKLARKIKPVLRCGRAFDTRAEKVYNYKITEFKKSPKIITSVLEDGRVEVKPNTKTFDVKKSVAFDYAHEPNKWRILDLKEIVDETKEYYRNGFFGYADGGHNIFDGFCSRSAIVCRAPKLVKICEIATLHYSPFEDEFLPAEIEVLMQIPAVLKKYVDAYELYLPGTEHDQIVKNYQEHGNHHKAYARLFRLADGETEPKKIKEYYNRISIQDTIG